MLLPIISSSGGKLTLRNTNFHSKIFFEQYFLRFTLSSASVNGSSPKLVCSLGDPCGNVIGGFALLQSYLTPHQRKTQEMVIFYVSRCLVNFNQLSILYFLFHTLQISLEHKAFTFPLIRDKLDLSKPFSSILHSVREGEGWVKLLYE